MGLAVVDAEKRLQPLCTWEEDERTFVVDVARSLRMNLRLNQLKLN